jgi:hypothetical protein
MGSGAGANKEFVFHLFSSQDQIDLLQWVRVRNTV